MITRVKEILTAPKKEWEVIAGGMQPMMKSPAEKNTGYFVVSLIATIVVSAVISGALGAIVLKSYFF